MFFIPRRDDGWQRLDQTASSCGTRQPAPDFGPCPRRGKTVFASTDQATGSGYSPTAKGEPLGFGTWLSATNPRAGTKIPSSAKPWLSHLTAACSLHYVRKERSVCRLPTPVELHHILPNSRTVTVAVFSPDGRLLAVADGERTVRLWDVKSGEHLRTLHGHTGMVRDVAFFPDGARLVTGSTDATVRIWDVDSGQELASLQGVRDAVNRVAVSPDGRCIAAVDTAVRIWDAASVGPIG